MCHPVPGIEDTSSVFKGDFVNHWATVEEPDYEDDYLKISWCLEICHIKVLLHVSVLQILFKNISVAW